MNLAVIIVFAVIVLALLIFLIVRNQKDEEVFEEQINEDYLSPKDIVEHENKDVPH